jgi:hypothetical protein
MVGSIRLARGSAVAALLTLGLMMGIMEVTAQEKGKGPAAKVGLQINDPKALQGYTLFSPLQSSKTYLIDMQGKVVRTWEGAGNPASCAYLLENGNLLRPCGLGQETKGFAGPAHGGRIQLFSWDGEILWDFKFFNDKQLPHHDIHPMPNGNVMLIVSDKKSPEEVKMAGRLPNLVGAHFLADSLVEIKQTGKTTGEVVWEWHLWDHLVQELDKEKPKFGKVAEHPELVDLNFGQDVTAKYAAKKDGLDKLKGIGYVGGGKGGGKGGGTDWTHVNGVAYNPDLDQLLFSIHNFSEIWIIDHSTTTAEAASHKGGKSGKGGDLLYRWGNPRGYGAGTKKDQTLFAQHNSHWIPKGLPGAGNILIFNNGQGRPDGAYSTVDEIIPPVDAKGQYVLKTGTAFGPEKATWSYRAPNPKDFYSNFISGAQRLPNGNTLICSGANGIVFEVTPEKEMVWKYVNPAGDQGKGGKGPGGPGGKGPGGKGPGGKGPPNGKGPPGGPIQLGQVLPGFVQDNLKLSDEQKKQMDDFQKEVTAKLDKILSEEQNKQLKDAKPGFGPGGFGTPPTPGQIITPFFEGALKLKDDQKKQVAELQKETDTKLEKVLQDDQRKQLKEMAAAPGGFGGPGGFGPGGFGGPGGPGGGPGGGGSLFRAYRFAANYPAFTGRDMKPGLTVEEMQAKKEKKGPPQ